uniref:Uncharacterized protein n=1 Tax=Globodera rostochiensis TaxID=31243 RepID=A0A914H9L3_GLORO
MYRRRASFVHHRHCSPPMRSAGGRSARHHSPPAAFRHANNDFRSPGPPSSTFRSRPPRGFAPFRVRAFCHHNRFRAVASAAPSVRAGFRGGRFAPPRAMPRGRPPPPRIPYHCRADISPRRSPCRSRSRSANTPPSTAATAAQHSSLRRSPSWSPPPPALAAERGARGGRNRSGFRGGGRFVAAGRSKFIGNYGRPINHPPAYEVSPDRTAPGASAGDDEIDAVQQQPAVEVLSNRDELYTKMMEAKKSENLDDYYRLRDTLNAFDVRNPHLAFRGSGATTSAAVTRKRSRSAGEKAAEPTAARKRKRGGGADDDGGEEDDHRHHQHRHHERKSSMTAPKKKKKTHEEGGAATAGGGGTTTSSAVGTADELEEVDSIDARYEQDKCNAKYVHGNAGGGDKRRKSAHERSAKQLKQRHSADTKSKSDSKCHRLQIALDSDAEKSPEKCVSRAAVVATSTAGRRRSWTKAHDERNGEDDVDEQAWLDELDDEEEEVGFDLVENEQLDNDDGGDGGGGPLPPAEKLDDDNVTASRDALQEVEEFAEVADEDDGEGGGGGECDYDAQSYGALFRPDFVTILQSSVAKGLRMRNTTTSSSSSSSNRRHHQQAGGTNGRQQQQNANANGTDGNGTGGTASVGQQEQQQPCTLVEMALARLVANTVEEIESSEF